MYRKPGATEIVIQIDQTQFEYSRKVQDLEKYNRNESYKRTICESS